MLIVGTPRPHGSRLGEVQDNGFFEPLRLDEGGEFASARPSASEGEFFRGEEEHSMEEEEEEDTEEEGNSRDARSRSESFHDSFLDEKAVEEKVVELAGDQPLLKRQLLVVTRLHPEPHEVVRGVDPSVSLFETKEERLNRLREEAALVQEERTALRQWSCENGRGSRRAPVVVPPVLTASGESPVSSSSSTNLTTSSPSVGTHARSKSWVRRRLSSLTSPDHEQIVASPGPSLDMDLVSPSVIPPGHLLAPPFEIRFRLLLVTNNNNANARHECKRTRHVMELVPEIRAACHIAEFSTSTLGSVFPTYRDHWCDTAAVCCEGDGGEVDVKTLAIAQIARPTALLVRRAKPTKHFLEVLTNHKLSSLPIYYGVVVNAELGGLPLDAKTLEALAIEFAAREGRFREQINGRDRRGMSSSASSKPRKASSREKGGGSPSGGGGKCAIL